MKPELLQELLDLMGWSRTRLAAELDVTEAAIHKWFRLGFVPGGSASILLTGWLELARNGLPLQTVELIALIASLQPKPHKNGRSKEKELVNA